MLLSCRESSSIPTIESARASLSWAFIFSSSATVSLRYWIVKLSHYSLKMFLDGMLNSTTWLYGAEVLPIALRSKVMGLAAASHFIVNVAGR